MRISILQTGNIFANFSINTLVFKRLINSTLFTNYFSFDLLSTENLNSEIEIIKLFVFNIELSNRILETKVFANLNSIKIVNLVSDIEKETFKEFKHLNFLTLSPYSFKQLFNLNTNWMTYLNFYVKEMMYKQMLYYSILNVMICMIFLFRLTIRCIDEQRMENIKTFKKNNFFSRS
jgi:hypothetical protein